MSPPEAAGQQIRVVLADDHPVVRAGLVSLLETIPEVTVLAEHGIAGALG